MRSVAPMLTAKIGYMVISGLMCALGIFVIAKPATSAAVLGLICGILMIVFGAVKLVGFFSRDLYRLAFQYDLALGILLIVLGIYMLSRPIGLMNFICITLGVSILLDGLFKIQIAMESRSFGIREWWMILAMAILAALAGLVLMFRPGEGTSVLMTVLGITLLAEGILNFSTMITAVKIIRHQQPDTDTVEVHDFRDCP